MIDIFENYIRTQADLSEDNIRHISGLAFTRKLRRNEFLFRAGEISRNKVFVASGLLRIFGMTPDGNEHILQFAPEFHWMVDGESYDQGTPSLYNIDAVEPSELLLWTKPDFDGLMTSIPQLKNFSEHLISRNTYLGRRRLLTALSATPEQKYQDFAQTFPDLLSRLPLRMIAAYLGMSLKTLNRARLAQLQRS